MSSTREAILRHLLHEKEGLTIEEMSALLGISRSGVQQHLTNLQRDRFVAETAMRGSSGPGGGRPSRVYALTERGYEQFPRRYATLSSLTLKTLKETVGNDVLRETFGRIARQLYDEVENRVAKKKGKERLAEAVDIMNELGYEASITADGEEISAVNCIYHHLANEIHEVCDLDVALLSLLTGGPVEQMACMVDGDHRCLFRPAQDVAE